MTEAIICDVAVVGSGPAGLSAAIALRKRGVERVIVLERESEAGGVPRHCGHPPFGLREFGRVLTGPAYARRLRHIAQEAGVDIRTGHSVVLLQANGHLVIATPNGMRNLQARRVVLATGARETPRSARLISGDRPLGVINTGTLQSSIYLKHLKLFSRPVVVGTELVGLSALWTCLGHGIRPAALIEERPGPIARWPLSLFPRLLGIPVHYGTRLTDIVGRARVDHVTIETHDGRAFDIGCDGVIFTGRFVPEASLMRMGVVDVDSGSAGPSVDQYGRCSDPAYYATGNLLRAIETAGWCYREGQRTGSLVADDLRGDLPATSHNVQIVRGPGVKLTVPQRLSLPTTQSTVDFIQIRASEAITGKLIVKAGGKTLWSRKIRTDIERRILVPLSGLAVPPDCKTIEISIEPAANS